MKHMMGRVAAWLLALCMMTTAAAEDVMPDFDAMLPLVDLTVAAALRVGEIPENITPEGTLSQEMVFNFFLMGKHADASLGITAEMLVDPAQQAAYLQGAFSAQAPSMEGVSPLTEDVADSTYDHIGLQIMASDMNDAGDQITLYGDLYQAEGALADLTETQQMQVTWLSWRAVVTLHKDAQAPVGWKIDSCIFEPTVVLESENGETFQQATVEYMNAELGFSVQYPAEFTEDTLQERSDGISASLQDGTATFDACRTANTQRMTLDERMAQIAQQYEEATVVVHEVSQTGRLTGVREDGFIEVTAVIVTDSWIYEAKMCYAPERATTFAVYSEYMINSLMVDELGIG